MANQIVNPLANDVRAVTHPLTGAANDYDALLDLVGDARFVLLGEASHGTHEFYRERAEVTKRLIAEKGFHAVAIEADWPDAYRVNCYVRGSSLANSANEALGEFKRFPTWMWRNTVVLDFVEWLRDHNRVRPAGVPQVGFYGVDLYSLYRSMEAVLGYLDQVDQEAAQRARYRYSCFEQFGENTQAYGYAASFGLTRSCESDVIKQLLELQRHATEYARRDGRVAEDEFFYAEQNARLVKNAEQYYRSMFGSRVASWNLRDRHMAETLEALVAHLDQQVGRTKLVVWEHNSHLGDARATERSQQGQLNVGQLVRERHGRDVINIGFTTYHGTVTAASDWGAPAERKRVRPGLPGSYETLFHEVGIERFLLILRAEHGAPPDAVRVIEALREPHLERAIGVVYRPETERISHYLYARLPDQFDAVLHFDETQAIEPLERTAGWEYGEVPETFPSAL
ncbi:MAG: erythromycin esterase family protein [Chloroflexi bacterium]|nr:erythromycin esterase family protein [Chloroflexota bacterium]